MLSQVEQRRDVCSAAMFTETGCRGRAGGLHYSANLPNSVLMLGVAKKTGLHPNNAFRGRSRALQLQATNKILQVISAGGGAKSSAEGAIGEKRMRKK